jgi:hypothetical protein
MKVRYLTIACVVFLLVLALISAQVAWTNWLLPARVFRRAVLDPVPASVKAIKAHVSSNAFDPGFHSYVLRFDIGAPDVQLILDSDQFKEIGYIEYSKNMLDFGETRRGSTISLRIWGDFWSKAPTPSWFEFTDQKGYKAYMVKEEHRDFFKAHLLLHNESLGLAYFIDYEAIGN